MISCDFIYEDIRLLRCSGLLFKDVSFKNWRLVQIAWDILKLRDSSDGTFWGYLAGCHYHWYCFGRDMFYSQFILVKMFIVCCRHLGSKSLCSNFWCYKLFALQHFQNFWNLISWASQMWFGYPKCLWSSCLGYLRISLFMLKTGLLRDERLSSSHAAIKK